MKIKVVDYATITNGKIKVMCESTAIKIISEVRKSCNDIDIIKKIREISGICGGCIFGIMNNTLGSPHEIAKIKINATFIDKEGTEEGTILLPDLVKGLLQFIDMISKRIGIPNIDNHTEFDPEEIDEYLEIIKKLISEENK